MRYTKEEIDIICDMSLTPTEAGEKIGRTGNAVRRSRQRFRKQGYDLPERNTGRPHSVKKRSSQKSGSIYEFVLNHEISAAWLDSSEVLDAKIAKVEQLLINLRKTRDMRMENDKTEVYEVC